MGRGDGVPHGKEKGPVGLQGAFFRLGERGPLCIIISVMARRIFREACGEQEQCSGGGCLIVSSGLFLSDAFAVDGVLAQCGFQLRHGGGDVVGDDVGCLLAGLRNDAGQLAQLATDFS